LTRAKSTQKHGDGNLTVRRVQNGKERHLRTGPAERQRRRRERLRNGVRIVRVEIDEIAAELALERLGYLEPLRADDPCELPRALTLLLDRVFQRITRDNGNA
jgi:hypothetical protein